jgi:hypothetical protein
MNTAKLREEVTWQLFLKNLLTKIKKYCNFHTKLLVKTQELA